MRKKKKIGLQDIIRKRQQVEFVGRAKQLDLFRTNLARSWDDEQRLFLFNVHGQGGVGKSTLLRRFQEIANSFGAVTALSDDQEMDAPSVMARFAAELKKQGQELKQFEARYKTYRQKREELEADPDAPQGFVDFAARTLTKATTRVVRHTVPGSSMILDLVDEDTLVTQAGNWAEYVRRRLTNKDEVHLVLQPTETLTPIFLSDLCELSDEKTICLFFDTYERTSAFLDKWLRDILDGRFGEAPADIILVIGGRDKLNNDLWLPFVGVLATISLEPFSENEARSYLALKDIKNEQVINIILELSGRLPLLVATLAAESPEDPSQIGEPTGTAISRFLKWVEDPMQRQVALQAALPRYLNYDVFAFLVPSNTEVLFNWLKKMPFMKEHAEGWVYHDVVRSLMLRHLRREAPQVWSERQGELATFHESLRDKIEVEIKEGVDDDNWKAYALGFCYHRLCQSPRQFLDTALNQFLDALKVKRTFAQRWASIMLQASVDSEDQELKSWSKQLEDGLKAYEDSNYPQTIELFFALLRRDNIEPSQHAIILAWRGETFRLMDAYDKALTDFDRAIELDPQYAWAIASRGQTFQAMKAYDKALTDFDRAIELDPQSAWAITSRGQTFRLMDAYDKALTDFDRAIELDPQSAWAIASRGQTFQAMKAYDKALTDFDRAIELDPQSAWAITSRGQTFQAMKAYDKALTDFDRAIELNPQYAWAIASRGEIFRLMDAYDKALTDFDRAIELNPQYAWAIASRGQTFQAMDAYDKALTDFDRAIELDPQSAWAITSRGQTFQAMDAYDKALTDFDRAIELDPQSAWAIASRGEIFQAMKAYDKALTDFDRAIELDPQSAWAIASRGETFRLMDAYDKALTDFDRAIELDPQYAWAIASRGQTFQAMKAYDKALTDFDRAIELNPQSAWAIASRGEIFQAMDAYDKALTDFDRAIELDPQSAWAIASRGQTFQAMKAYDKALTDFDRAIELNPQYAWVITSRGQTYRLMKAYEKAIQEYDRAIQLEPENRFYYNNLGGICLTCRQFDKAINNFQRRIELDAEDALNAYVKLGIIYYYKGDKMQAAANWQNALSIWETASERQLQSPAELLGNKTLALLGIGRLDEALLAIDEMIQCWQPSDEADLYVYELLSEAPEPPEGLKQILEKIKPLIDAQNVFGLHESGKA